MKEFSAGLLVQDFEVPVSAVTEFLQLEPFSWDEPDPQTGRRGCWLLDVKSVRDETFDSVLQRMLEILEPQCQQIIDISKRWTVCIWCGVFYNTFTASLAIGPDTLLRLGQLGLEIVVSTYPCSDEDDEED